MQCAKCTDPLGTLCFNPSKWAEVGTQWPFLIDFGGVFSLIFKRNEVHFWKKIPPHGHEGGTRNHIFCSLFELYYHCIQRRVYLSCIEFYICFFTWNLFVFFVDCIHWNWKNCIHFCVYSLDISRRGKLIFHFHNNSKRKFFFVLLNYIKKYLKIKNKNKMFLF